MDPFMNSNNNGTKPENAWGTDSGQSPGEPEIYFSARLIAGVIVFKLDVSLLDLLSGPSFVRNPYGELARAVEGFAQKYNRTPTVNEYDDIRKDVIDAALGIGSDKDIGKRVAEDRLQRVTEYVVDWDDLDEQERQPIIDRIMRDADWRRVRQALLDARTAMDRDGGLEEAREILAKVQATTATGTAVNINAGDPWDFPEIEFIVDGLIPKRGLMFVGALATTIVPT